MREATSSNQPEPGAISLIQIDHLAVFPDKCPQLVLADL